MAPRFTPMPISHVSQGTRAPLPPVGDRTQRSRLQQETQDHPEDAEEPHPLAQQLSDQPQAQVVLRRLLTVGLALQPGGGRVRAGCQRGEQVAQHGATRARRAALTGMLASSWSRAPASRCLPFYTSIGLPAWLGSLTAMQVTIRGPSMLIPLGLLAPSDVDSNAVRQPARDPTRPACLAVVA